MFHELEAYVGLLYRGMCKLSMRVDTGNLKLPSKSEGYAASVGVYVIVPWGGHGAMGPFSSLGVLGYLLNMLCFNPGMF